MQKPQSLPQTRTDNLPEPATFRKIDLPGERTAWVKETSLKTLGQGTRALHKHHVFPQQYRKWFASRGITNIDDYAIKLSPSTHLKGVHGRGLGNLPGRWNQHWKQFIQTNPNATPSQIFHHAESLLQRFGLEHSRYVPYK
ncbi:MAG: TIGR02269 family lipoprotein [Carboxylicivirga sp.]|nr:TIGR02269 family lipoprotein [Carboxylicivirga sp.]